MKNQNYLLILIAVATLSGCIPPLYHASVTNAPLFSKKGEINATAAHGKAGNDIQAAYSVSNNSAIMLNCSFGNKVQTGTDTGSTVATGNINGKTRSIDKEYNYGYHFNFVEGGYGFYLTPKNGSDLRAEVFGLIGTGYAESFNGLINYRAYGKYMRYSIQGDLGYAGKMTEGAFTLRIGYLDFGGLNTTQSSDMSSVSGPIQPSANNGYSSGKTNSFFIDPAVTFRLGYKGVKFFLQSGMSLPISNHLNFGWEKSWGSIGVQIRLNSGK